MLTWLPRTRQGRTQNKTLQWEGEETDRIEELCELDVVPCSPGLDDDLNTPLMSHKCTAVTSTVHKWRLKHAK